MHPLTKEFLQLVEKENTNLHSIAEITGITSTCLYGWRSEEYPRNPSLHNFDLALRSIGYCLKIKHLGE